ncbi:MAG: asparagine synthase-related protein [bacterium]|nr:asparagine synthase-related protein [bacterium]
MLLISIKPGKLAETSNGLSEKRASFTVGDKIITIEVDQPYGFVTKQGDRIIAGESLCPPDDSAIRTLVTHLSKKSDNTHLGYGIYFAAFFDKSAERLSLYNSVSSSRPYYIYQGTDHWVLSTSLRAMRNHGVDLQLNDNALPELLIYRFVSAPNSLVKDISTMPGGESMELDLNSIRVVSRRSYDFRIPDESQVSDVTDSWQKAEQILTSNISDSLQSSSQPGMLLSGGLDSSLLGVLAVKGGHQPDSVSSGFSFANKDDLEAEYATTVANHIGVKHRLFEGNEELYLRGLVEAAYHAEMPLHHLQSVMLYLLFKDARTRGNDLFLCGEAADGLFGNDAHQRCHKFAALNSLLNIPPLRAMVRAAVSLKPNDYRLSFFSHEFGPKLDHDRHFLYNLGQYTQLSLVSELFGYDLSQVVGSHKQLMLPFEKQPLLNKISIISLLCEGSVTMSVWSKLAEGVSLRIAYPFAAENLIDHVNGIPWNQKLIEPKFLIREILRANRFKEEFISRPKRSFGFPANFWALPGKLFQPLVEMVSEKFDRGMLNRLQKADMSHAMLLWNLINVYLFETLVIKDADQVAFGDDLLSRYRKMNERKSA